MAAHDKITLGISSCLLGNNVRFDGGHAWDRYLTDTLGQYVEYVPVCPEVECGLSVPREAMRLVGNVNTPRLITVHSGKDYTDKMLRWARKRVSQLEQENLCGFIFKSKSPSSGMERAKVYNENGVPAKKGVGMFARSFMEHFPLLPVEDDGRLHDPGLRENFIVRIFAYQRWREVLEQKKKIGPLVDFHTRHKLLILSHSLRHYQIMGKLVASDKNIPLARLYAEYQSLLMESLAIKTTARKNSNVLQHMMGYFKEQLSADEKQELLEIINQYRQEIVPLIVPVTLINHYVRTDDQPYLKNQYYLHPHPAELQLRNHV
jgi:uncharacterized protein YbgA (DUF1722 family)/uncharacterized protein YbbK (DUF523 family)